MDSIKPSTLVSRQLPQHIRESYPLFVDFLKTYYKFLDNSQQTLIDEIPEITDERIDKFNNEIRLEKIRDIDTSLDVFITQFKSEFAENVPIDKAQDPRMLIKHLRDFYLSRGSEASYKFLFRTLFDKEAELFYPSSQILKVSDGKWQQDISIFVYVQPGFPDLEPLNGNYITISTTRNVAGRNITKRLTTYVNRVVEYSSGTFELYIQRDYINEIDIGSIVSFEDSNGVNYLGTVLPCPSKLVIEKGGKGFRIGQIFALQTQIGRGCIVKVSKVGPQGEIKDIRLVEIGLDYLTTFYSYLSNKDLPSFEYIHPAKLNTPYVPGTPAYNELLGGFTDYGFASKQTYFAYDTNVNVGLEEVKIYNSNASMFVDSKGADRFFADPAYVGDLDAQFFAVNKEKPIDDDVAMIRVDLGAVAKYPGYYLNQDGFISDEMYIQDGKYYQAYSYVIKVEEELRRYADVIKKVLHPAGLRFFAEYTINTEITFESALESLRKVLDKVDTVRPLDQGFNYAAYVIDEDSPDISYVPAPGASVVYSKFGKAALFTKKRFADSINGTDSNVKAVNKALVDSVGTNNDTQVKLVTKALSHAIGLLDGGFAYDNYVTSIVNGTVSVAPHPEANVVFKSSAPSFYSSKRLTELVTSLSRRAKSTSKPLVETATILDAIVKAYGKRLVESMSLSDAQIKTLSKSLTEIVVSEDSTVNDSVKTITDTIVILEAISKLLDKPLAETVSIDDQSLKSLVKAVESLVTLSDQLNSIDDNKNIQDNITTSVLLAKSLSRTLENSISLDDATSNLLSKLLSDDSVSTADLFELIRSKGISDLVYASSSTSKDTLRFLEDTAAAIDVLSNQFSTSRADTISLLDSILISRTIFFNDVISAIDDVMKTIVKAVSETITLEDYSTKLLDTIASEAINIEDSGYLALNPYDEEAYSSPDDQYTAITPIT